MKNIILQHFTGKLGELEIKSNQNIQKYAKYCGAEYRLVTGDLFHKGFTSPCQKLHMLSPIFDSYDNVVMLDIDMFVRKGMQENIFDINGIGIFCDIQQDIKDNMISNFPHLCDKRYAYWGGAIYKLTKEQRIKFRENINFFELSAFNNHYQDEGMMHRLAVLTKTKQKDTTLPDGYKWCHCSFRSDIQNAALIHVRPKVTPTGPKREKIVNYRDLVLRDLIEE
jgi:hypothetical protein